jgi:DNA-binding SARP family transcriptional activator
MLRINVLGPVIFEADGQALKLSRKGKALMAYLALRGEAIPRARLADLLWPRQVTGAARHSLRNCLLECRKAAGDDALAGDFLNCWLVPRVETDLHRFSVLRSSHARADLRAACNLVRGPLFENFEIDSDPWDEFVYGERELFEEMLSSTLTTFSLLLTGDGEHDEAVSVAHRLVKLDPLCERSHRLLMMALLAGGRRSEALRQYRKLVQILAKELSVHPDEESRALAEAISNNRTVGRPARPVSPAISQPKADPAADALTGELKRLGAALADWTPGRAGVTTKMIPQAGRAMLAAAAERERAATIAAPAPTRVFEMLEPFQLLAPERDELEPDESYQQRVEPPHERVAA